MALTVVSIDIETTGLNPKVNQVIEFGAVIDDWSDPQPYDKLPTFQSFIRHPSYVCEPYAAYMHGEIFGILGGALDMADGESSGTPGYAFAAFYKFLIEYGYTPARSEHIHFIPAGKNFASFDALFLSEMVEWTNRFRPFRRSLDPAILYCLPDDVELPDTEKCLERAGLPVESPHRAVPDAITTLKLLRAKMLV